MPRASASKLKIAMFIVPSGFIGDFKIGDNINYNLRILALLYRHFDESTEFDRGLLCKPITLLLVAITEALLYDFHFRCNRFTWEGVANLGDEALSYIRGKTINKFSKYIQSAKRHDLLDAEDGVVYEQMELLNKIRNRIHIQNEKNDLERDEVCVFTMQRKIIAEQVLERAMKTLAKKYPRPDRVSGFVKDFQLPWSEHYSG